MNTNPRHDEQNPSFILMHATHEWISQSGVFGSDLLDEYIEEQEKLNKLDAFLYAEIPGMYLIVVVAVMILLMMITFTPKPAVPWVGAIGCVLVLVTWSISRMKIASYNYTRKKVMEMQKAAPVKDPGIYQGIIRKYPQYFEELIEHLDSKDWKHADMPAIRGVIEHRDIENRCNMPPESQCLMADYLMARASMEEAVKDPAAKALSLSIQKRFSLTSQGWQWYEYVTKLPKTSLN